MEKNIHNWYGLGRPRRSIAVLARALMSQGRGYRLLEGSARPKRFSGAIAKGALQGLKKYGPEILLTATAVYQIMENEKLEHHIEELKTKFVKLTQLSLKLEKVEYETISQHLNKVTEQELQLKLEGEINTYMTTLQALLSSQLAKYQNIKSFQPIDELKDYVSTLSGKLGNVELPQATSPAMLFRNMNSEVVNERITMVYTIPMVKKQKFTEVAIITIPDDNGTMIALDGQRLAVRVALDNQNKTVFSTEFSEHLFDNVYQETSLAEVNPCIAAILGAEKTKILADNCGIISLANFSEQIFSLREDLLIVFSENATRFTVTCPEKEETLSSIATLVYFPECTVANGNQTWAAVHHGTTITDHFASQNGNRSFAPANIEIATFHVDPRIPQWRAEIERELANSDDWLTRPSHTVVGYLAVGLPVFTGLLTILRLPRRRKPDSNDHIEMRIIHGIPWSQRWTQHVTDRPVAELSR